MLMLIMKKKRRKTSIFEGRRINKLILKTLIDILGKIYQIEW